MITIENIDPPEFWLSSKLSSLKHRMFSETISVFPQVPGFQTVTYPIEASVVRGGEVVQTNTLGLHRSVTREDFTSHNSSLNIKCVASIYTAYYKTVEQMTTLKMRKKLKRRRGDLRKKQQQNQQKTDKNNGKTDQILLARLFLTFAIFRRCHSTSVSV